MTNGTLRKFASSVRRNYRQALLGPHQLRKASRSHVIRIVLGTSGHFTRGWIPTDVDYLDVTNEGHWARFFQPGTIDAVLAEHVWEHLSPADAVTGAEICHKYLKAGGYLRVAVPDGLHPSPSYVEKVKPGGSGPGAHDHKVLYTCESLSTLFAGVGFRIDFLEYFDNKGEFHSRDWDPAAGMIRRSLRFDERNCNGEAAYTSIILDAHKVF
jgi:predicted SAM-dependent methyltransferase